jgi:hypothetical protein
MKNQNFVVVHYTNNQAELAVIKSLLDNAGIDYFIGNENLNTLYGVADGFTLMDIKVAADKVEEAKELLKDFINPKGENC